MSACILAGMVAGGAAAGEKYYRWVDDNGQVHFGERPQHGIASEELELRVPGTGESGNTMPVGLKSRETGQRDEEDAEAPPLTAEEVADRKQKCQRARKEITLYSAGRRMRVRSKDGSVEYLTEEKRGKWLEDLRKVEKEYCT